MMVAAKSCPQLLPTYDLPSPGDFHPYSSSFLSGNGTSFFFAVLYLKQEKETKTCAVVCPITFRYLDQEMIPLMRIQHECGRLTNMSVAISMRRSIEGV